MSEGDNLPVSEAHTDGFGSDGSATSFTDVVNRDADLGTISDFGGTNVTDIDCIKSEARLNNTAECNKDPTPVPAVRKSK